MHPLLRPCLAGPLFKAGRVVKDSSSISLFVVASLCLITSLLGYLVDTGISRSIFVSTIRAFFQLLFLGKILEFIFLANHSFLNALIAGFMTFFAVYTIYSRLPSKNRFTFFSLVPCLCLTAWPTSILLIYFTSKDDYSNAAIFIPLLGMILGNTLNGISLGVQRTQIEMKDKRDYIITYLGMGASWIEATKPVFISSLQTAITPILNNMLVVGIVGLPGLMTGQILAGQDPGPSAKYQFLILGSIFLTLFWGSLLGILLQIRWFFPEKLYFREAS